MLLLLGGPESRGDLLGGAVLSGKVSASGALVGGALFLPSDSGAVGGGALLRGVVSAVGGLIAGASLGTVPCGVGALVGGAQYPEMGTGNLVAGGVLAGAFAPLITQRAVTTGTQAFIGVQLPVHTIEATFAITPAGVSRILWVAIVSASVTTAPAASCTFAGVSLTRLVQVSDSFDAANVELWYMINPPAVTANVVVDAVSDYGLVAAALAYDGVLQSAPTISVGAGSSLSSPSLSLTTTVDGSYVIDVLGQRATGTANVGQVAQWVQTATGSFTSSIGAGSTKVMATAGTTTVGWTGGDASNETAYAAAAFAPDPYAYTRSATPSATGALVGGVTYHDIVPTMVGHLIWGGRLVHRVHRAGVGFIG